MGVSTLRIVAVAIAVLIAVISVLIPVLTAILITIVVAVLAITLALSLSLSLPGILLIVVLIPRFASLRIGVAPLAVLRIAPLLAISALSISIIALTGSTPAAIGITTPAST